MVNYVRNKYNKRYIAFVDVESVAGITLMSALRAYKSGSKKSFASYYMDWLSSDITRDAIKNQPGIRMPERLAKKDFQISPEARALMIAGKAKEELMEIYGLEEELYDKLVHYYTEVPRYLEVSSEDYAVDRDISIDITKVLDVVPTEYRKPIIMYFGLLGFSRHTAAQIKSYCKVEMKEVLKYLKDNETLKDILGGYDG